MPLDSGHSSSDENTDGRKIEKGKQRDGSPRPLREVRSASGAKEPDSPVHDLAEQRYLEQPDSLETIKKVVYDSGKPSLDKLKYWIQHYEETQKLTTNVGLQTAHLRYDGSIPKSLQDTSDISKLPDYTYHE